MKIKFKKSKNKEFYWVAIAKNGKQIFKSSETYKTKRAAKHAWNLTVRDIQTNSYKVIDETL